MVYRDSHGRTLADYPRPSVAVDTAVLTAAPDVPLSVVVVREDGVPRLPGTFLHEPERLSQAVQRSLQDKARLRSLRPEQLHVFDDPSRDDRGWVLSVAHLATMSWAEVEQAQVETLPVERLPRMPFDHNQVVDYAVRQLQAWYVRDPDPRGFLSDSFTLRTLQRLHEQVAGTELMRDAFRRRMEPQLVPTGELERGAVGKPARLFRRA